MKIEPNSEHLKYYFKKLVFALINKLMKKGRLQCYSTKKLSVPYLIDGNGITN